MRLTYDPRHNVGYIAFREGPAEVDTLRLSEELNVDIAPDGTVYGIELLNASEQLGLATARRLVITNEASGESQEVTLAG